MQPSLTTATNSSPIKSITEKSTLNGATVSTANSNYKYDENLKGVKITNLPSRSQSKINCFLLLLVSLFFN
jgi:hypothetical protein